MTPLNTLKNWFRNGLKPTQEQFWAWMDSFRHKADKIPVGDIENLDQVLANKADADALAFKADLVDGKVPLSQMPFADDVIDVAAFADLSRPGDKTKLYKTDDGKVYSWKESVTDYVLAGVDEARIAALEAGKVNEPTSDGSWVRQKLGSVFSWVNANDFGKNTANSWLTSIVNAGLNLGAAWRIKTNGFNFNIEDLADKSVDATFDKMLVQNSTGTVGKSSGKTLFMNMPSLLSNAEKNSFSAQINGGWTTNTMSVASLTPPIAAKKDIAQWFILRGANLNLNPEAFTVHLVSQTLVEYQVPNSQVQLYQSGLDLAFWYNFKDLPLGKYKIKLWNGIASYITGATVEITLVSEVTPIDFSGITWEKISKTQSEVDNTITAMGTAVSHRPNLNNAPYSAGNIQIVASAKSSQIVGDNENFYIKGYLNIGMSYLEFWGGVIGIIDSDNTLSLNNSATAYITVRGDFSNLSGGRGYIDNEINPLTSGINTHAFQNTSFEFIIIRNQGIYTMILSTEGRSRVYVKTGSQKAISLAYYGIMATNYANGGASCTFSSNIIEGYKF